MEKLVCIYFYFYEPFCSLSLVSKSIKENVKKNVVKIKQYSSNCEIT